MSEGTYHDLAVARVTRFMDLNYPCACPPREKDDCPGNRYEAGEIVRIVEEVYFPHE